MYNNPHSTRLAELACSKALPLLFVFFFSPTSSPICWFTFRSCWMFHGRHRFSKVKFTANLLKHCIFPGKRFCNLLCHETRREALSFIVWRDGTEVHYNLNRATLGLNGLKKCFNFGVCNPCLSSPSPSWLLYGLLENSPKKARALIG